MKSTNGQSGMRVALYSPYDGMGMGHVRRNLLIAQSLVAHQDETDVLMISGAHEASVLPSGPGIDYLTIPGLRKQLDGTYAARSMNMDIRALVELRTQAISAPLMAFNPHLLIVDKKARGVLGELDPILETLSKTGKTKIVLGLRDVLDEPEAVAREWHDADYATVIEQFYDAVWVYGDRRIYDLAAEARLPEPVGRPFEFTGYLDQQMRLSQANTSARALLAETGVQDNPFALCMVGGGEDGMPLADSFARADLPRGMHGVAVLGPFMPAHFRRTLHDLAAERPRFHVIDFVGEPTVLIHAAERVICMGGYGAFTEVVSFEKPALIVPRVKPRKEQLVRAERFAKLGLVDCLTPDRLTPAALTAWLSEETRAGEGARSRIDLGGIQRLPRMADALLFGATHGQARPARRSPHPSRILEERAIQHPTLANLVPSEQL